MPLKNLNFFEKHIEKVVLAVGVLFALLVTWFYVLASPYNVTLASIKGKEMTPTEIEREIDRRAASLRDQIRESAPSNLPPMKIPRYTDEFRKRHGNPLLEIDRLDIPFSKFGLDPDLFKGQRTLEQRDYFIPTPPEPASLRYASGFGVLAEPYDEKLVAAFEDLIGKQIPRDFTWVSVSAEFDLKVWRQLLTARPPVGMQPVPESWWRPKMIVADVMLLKQVYDVEQGKWGESQTLQQVPGNEWYPFLGGDPLSFRVGRERWAVAEADEAVQLARRNGSRLARPPFPDLAEGLWLPPDADPQSMTPDQREKFELLKQDIEVLQKRLKSLSALTGEVPASPSPTPAAGLPGSAAVRPGAGPGAPAAPVDAAAAMNDPVALKNLLERKRREMYVLLKIEEAELAAEDGNALGAADESGRDVLKIWQHDLTVKPGQTVRYAMIANLLNPVFFQNSLSQSQRKDFFNKLTLASLQSPWTDPIQVLSEHDFFLTGADPAHKQVTVEVYAIFNGQWQVQSFTIAAGDPIGRIVKMSTGGVERAVNMNVGAVVVDIDFDAPAREGIVGGKNTRLIYYDQASGSLVERNLDEDRNSPKRQDLSKKAGNRVAGL